jgi:hypothetical protein
LRMIESADAILVIARRFCLRTFDAAAKRPASAQSPVSGG